jgi:hypothetical protein
VDPGLHRLQGQAEHVTSAGLLALLQDVYGDKLASVQQHRAAVRSVARYEFNNTYQFVIAREETQLSWLRAAIEELGGAVPASAAPAPVTDMRGSKGDADLGGETAALAQAFVDRWRGRVDQVTDARHQGMLHVILGEALEHKRFFDQIATGRADLSGRLAQGTDPAGKVLPVRWVE